MFSFVRMSGNGASSCEHGRRRSACKECGGSSFHEHGRQRSRSKECGSYATASTVGGAQPVQGVRRGASICERTGGGAAGARSNRKMIRRTVRLC